MTEFHRAQLHYAEVLSLRATIDELEFALDLKTRELRDADREIRALRDELDYVHQERDDLEKQQDRQPRIPWLRKVGDDRWSITDRD